MQRNEPLFLVLDGAMIAAASILLTVAHPGFFFPQLTSGYWKKVERGEIVGVLGGAERAEKSDAEVASGSE